MMMGCDSVARIKHKYLYGFSIEKTQNNSSVKTFDVLKCRPPLQPPPTRRPWYSGEKDECAWYHQPRPLLRYIKRNISPKRGLDNAISAAHSPFHCMESARFLLHY